MNCENCGSEMRRSQRASLGSYWMGCLCVFPYRCTHCKRRVNRVHWEQACMFYSVIFAMVLILATGAFWYRARHKQAPRPAAVALNLDARMPDGSVAQGGSAAGPRITIRLDNILSNQDIVDLNKANLRADVITRLIRTSPHNFKIDPKALISLKESGTPDDVIAAMIEVTPAPGGPDAPVMAGLVGSSPAL